MVNRYHMSEIHSSPPSDSFTFISSASHSISSSSLIDYVVWCCNVWVPILMNHGIYLFIGIGIVHYANMWLTDDFGLRWYQPYPVVHFNLPSNTTYRSSVSKYMYLQIIILLSSLYQSIPRYTTSSPTSGVNSNENVEIHYFIYIAYLGFYSFVLFKVKLKWISWRVSSAMMIGIYLLRYDYKCGNTIHIPGLPLIAFQAIDLAIPVYTMSFIIYSYYLGHYGFYPVLGRLANIIDSSVVQFRESLERKYQLFVQQRQRNRSRKIREQQRQHLLQQQYMARRPRPSPIQASQPSVIDLNPGYSNVASLSSLLSSSTLSTSNINPKRDDFNIKETKEDLIAPRKFNDDDSKRTANNHHHHRSFLFQERMGTYVFVEFEHNRHRMLDSIQDDNDIDHQEDHEEEEHQNDTRNMNLTRRSLLMPNNSLASIVSHHYWINGYHQSGYLSSPPDSLEDSPSSKQSSDSQLVITEWDGTSRFIARDVWTTKEDLIANNPVQYLLCSKTSSSLEFVYNPYEKSLIWFNYPKNDSMYPMISISSILQHTKAISINQYNTLDSDHDGHNDDNDQTKNVNEHTYNLSKYVSPRILERSEYWQNSGLWQTEALYFDSNIRFHPNQLPWKPWLLQKDIMRLQYLRHPLHYNTLALPVEKPPLIVGEGWALVETQAMHNNPPTSLLICSTTGQPRFRFLDLSNKTTDVDECDVCSISWQFKCYDGRFLIVHKIRQLSAIQGRNWKLHQQQRYHDDEEKLKQSIGDCVVMYSNLSHVETTQTKGSFEESPNPTLSSSRDLYLPSVSEEEKDVMSCLHINHYVFDLSDWRDSSKSAPEEKKEASSFMLNDKDHKQQSRIRPPPLSLYDRLIKATSVIQQQQLQQQQQQLIPIFGNYDDSSQSIRAQNHQMIDEISQTFSPPSSSFISSTLSTSSQHVEYIQPIRHHKRVYYGFDERLNAYCITCIQGHDSSKAFQKTQARFIDTFVKEMEDVPAAYRSACLTPMSFPVHFSSHLSNRLGQQSAFDGFQKFDHRHPFKVISASSQIGQMTSRKMKDYSILIHEGLQYSMVSPGSNINIGSMIYLILQYVVEFDPYFYIHSVTENIGGYVRTLTDDITFEFGVKLVLREIPHADNAQ